MTLLNADMIAEIQSISDIYRERMTQLAERANRRPPSAQTLATHDVLAERERQMSQDEEFGASHDDTHVHGELALAAAAYAAAILYPTAVPWYWPWNRRWWKPTNRRRDLVKAGALILAEIERLDRAATKASEVKS
ncbi:MAG TPA: hypothetical protein VF638_14180 [Sphingomonas sp.]|jgi:hypothetical protein